MLQRLLFTERLLEMLNTAYQKILSHLKTSSNQSKDTEIDNTNNTPKNTDEIERINMKILNLFEKDVSQPKKLAEVYENIRTLTDDWLDRPKFVDKEMHFVLNKIKRRSETGIKELDTAMQSLQNEEITDTKKIEEYKTIKEKFEENIEICENLIEKYEDISCFGRKLLSNGREQESMESISDKLVCGFIRNMKNDYPADVKNLEAQYVCPTYTPN